jgi:hypothetical protein
MTGGVTIGAATSRAHGRGTPAMLLLLFCHAGLLAAQIGLALRPAGVAVTILWVLFAFFASGATSGYIVLGQMFPAERMGRVSTAVNTLTLGGAFLLQSAIGGILDLWPRTAQGGWDPRGYSAALGVSLVIQIFVAARLLLGRR